MDNMDFVAELAKLKPASTFLTLHGYRNEASEVADYSIAFHMSYKSALERSLTKLETLTPSNDLEKLARTELMASFQKSLAKTEEAGLEEVVDPTYTRFIDDDGEYIKGVKLHTATQALHIYGLVVHKKVLMPGAYPKTNKKPLTMAKDKMRYLTPVGKFRQFKILPEQVDRIVVSGLSLLPPEE